MHRSAITRAAAGSTPNATFAVYHSSPDSVRKRRPSSVTVHCCPKDGSMDSPVPRWMASPSNMESQPIPTAPGPNWRQIVVVHVGDVLEHQSRSVGAVAADADVDPADVAAVLPGGGEVLRRVARQDGSAGLALQLVGAADLQIAGNRQEPPRNALDIGDRVPEVCRVGVVGLTDGDDVRLPRVDRAGPDVALNRLDLMVDVNLNHVAFLDFCVVVCRVRFRCASASRCGVQKRRNASSHSSTSRNAGPFTAYSRR